MQPSIEKMPPNSPNEIRKALYKSNLTKAENYRNGLWLFGIGVILILVPLGIGAWAASLPPNTPTGDVQLVIKDTGMQYITQIPIELVPGTKKTVVVSLRNTTATSYSIRLNNGDTVDLEKGWIQAVIWKTNETRQDSQQSATPGMANPASVSCDQAGGAVEINKDAAGNEYGMCTFKNGTSCEEWALFRGEGCKPGLTATPADQEKNMVMFTEADNGKTEDVIQDTQFGVVLAENPSTGFAWNATLSSGLELQSDDYQDDTSAGRVGAGGNHTWVINVKEPGDQKFSAVYKRSWEPVRGNETTYSINIRVGKA
jgi:predicted secreted protein/putative hemolysin